MEVGYEYHAEVEGQKDVQEKEVMYWIIPKPHSKLKRLFSARESLPGFYLKSSKYPQSNRILATKAQQWFRHKHTITLRKIKAKAPAQGNG